MENIWFCIKMNLRSSRFSWENANITIATTTDPKWIYVACTSLQKTISRKIPRNSPSTKLMICDEIHDCIEGSKFGHTMTSAWFWNAATKTDLKTDRVRSALFLSCETTIDITEFNVTTFFRNEYPREIPCRKISTFGLTTTPLQGIWLRPMVDCCARRNE